MQKKKLFLCQNLRIWNNFYTFAAKNCKRKKLMPSQEVQNMIPKIQKFFKNQPVEQAYLFGSCSRGEERKDSDVDLLVTYTDSDSLSLMDISRMMIQLGKQLRRKVDIVEDSCLKPFAQASVNRDKIMIYERAY